LSLNLHLNAQELPKSRWKVIDFTEKSDINNDNVGNLIDGKRNTYWESPVLNKKETFPCFVIIDMGASAEINKISFYQREYYTYLDKVERFQVFGSIDEGKWTHFDIHLYFFEDSTEFNRYDTNDREFPSDFDFKGKSNLKIQC
jgi:hypothetical protein